MVVARERAGARLVDVTYHAGVREATVERWERGEHLPRDLDPALDAYAKATGRDGPRAMWELALELWREHDADPATRFEGEAEQAAPPPDERDESSEEDPPAEDATGEAP